MSEGANRPLRLRALPLLLLIPLVAVPAVAFVVLTGGADGGRLPVAKGIVGGTLHPIAGTFEPDRTELTGCDGDFACLEQAFGNIAFRDGPDPALALFEERIEVDRDVQHNCHRIAHTIGSAALARYRGSIAKTFAQGSATCASGYYHGILERAFVGASSKPELAEVSRSLCVATGIRRRGFLDYQCRHGLGHGFMIQTGYHLPTALSLCGQLGTRWDELTCTSGAFMENASVRFGFRSQWLKDDDPQYPCNTLAQRHKRSCYLRATTWMLQMNGNDFGETARACDAAGEPWTTYCFRGFGRDAVVEARYLDAEKVHSLCAFAGRHAGACAYGAARTFSDGSSLEGVRQAAAYCGGVAEAERATCVAGYGIILGLLYPTDERRRAACGRFAGVHAEACSLAAIAEVQPDGRGAWG